MTERFNPDFGDFPERIMIQTHSRCNASCEFCPYPEIGHLSHGLMEEALFEKMITECEGEKDRVINILPYLMNEPLLDKNLISKVEFIKKKLPQTCVHFLTNGALLDDKTSQAILHSPLDWIGISFFGNDKESYEKSMGMPYETVKKRVEEFVKKAVQERGENFVMITFFKWRQEEKEDLKSIDHWKKLGVKRITYHQGGISRAGNARNFKAPVKMKMNRCNSIWAEKMLHVLYNGDVVLCCMDWRRRHVLGNLNHQTIREIWNGKEYGEKRRVIRGIKPLGQEMICSRCEMADERPKKMVMIHPHDLFSHKEPWTIRIKALAKEMKEGGFEVELVTFTLDGFEEPSFIQEGIRIHTFSRKVSLTYFFKKITLLKEIIKDADIVWFQKAFHYASLPVLIAAISLKKWLHYDWDDDETAIYFSGNRVPSYWIGWGLALLEKWLPKVVDSLSYSSDPLRKKALASGIDPDRIFKVPVGANPAQGDSGIVRQIREKYGLTDFLSIVYLGQLHGAQYAELLIRSAFELKKKGYRFKLVIVGDGYDRPRLEKLSLDLDLAEIIFTGALPNSQTPYMLHACNVAVACFEKNKITISKSPLKIAEYLAAGKAIIAHDVGEVKEMLGGAGLLCDPDDKESLLRALIQLIDHPAQILEMEEKAKNRSKELTWKASATQIIDFFKGVSQNVSI